MGHITDQQEKEAAQYAEDFLRVWLRLLEVEYLTQPGSEDRFGHTISSAFRLRYFRYAEQKWSDKHFLLGDIQKQAVTHPEYVDEFLPIWLENLKKRPIVPATTRSGLHAYVSYQVAKKKRGTIPSDGWHQLIAVVVHNTSLRYGLKLLADGSNDEESAMGAVIVALANMFPGADLDYTKKAPRNGEIPGHEWFKKVWQTWRWPLRPSPRGLRSAAMRPGFGHDLLETEEDVFYAFFLTTTANGPTRSAKEH